MRTEIGEYIVGAYLSLVKKCDVVQYNTRPPGGGKGGLSELDVIGLNFGSMDAYLCEVTTHILGLDYGKGHDDSFLRMQKKFLVHEKYARERLVKFRPHLMLWSPKVSERSLVPKLQGIAHVELMVNKRYQEAIIDLLQIAKEKTHDLGNPFMRALQILACTNCISDIASRREPAMISNVVEYEMAQDEIYVLEKRLRKLQKDNPLGSKGFTKAGIRKLITRLHEELAVFEESEEACKPHGTST